MVKLLKILLQITQFRASDYHFHASGDTKLENFLMGCAPNPLGGLQRPPAAKLTRCARLIYALWASKLNLTYKTALKVNAWMKACIMS